MCFGRGGSINRAIKINPADSAEPISRCLGHRFETFRGNNVVSSGSSYRGCRTSGHLKFELHTGDPHRLTAQFWKKKKRRRFGNKDEKAEASRRRRRRGNAWRGEPRDGNDITRTARGLSRRSNLNGPFGTGVVGRVSLIESIESN